MISPSLTDDRPGGPAFKAWQAAGLYAAFYIFFALLIPIYVLNKWRLRRDMKSRPFQSSALVSAQVRFPLFYELAMLVQNFPVYDGVYDVLPDFKGDVLQVGCGTGLLNRRLRHRRDVRFTNLDPNLHALRLGRRLGRLKSYLHSGIDGRTPLADNSFDVIVFARSFHHVRNHRRALRECVRLLRPGGAVIIADIVMLRPPAGRADEAFMANSSIDGMIWRFTREAFVQHLRASVPADLVIDEVRTQRQLHITNFNPVAPQSDVVAILRKGTLEDA